VGGDCEFFKKKFKGRSPPPPPQHIICLSLCDNSNGFHQFAAKIVLFNFIIYVFGIKHKFILYWDKLELANELS